MNHILHTKLKNQLLDNITSIRDNMIARFAILLPYDEIQSMLMSDDTRHTLQAAGKCMEMQYTSYSYKLGEMVTIKITGRGGKEMPAIFFPSVELTKFSEDFLDIVRPLYLITKSWSDVLLAFEVVCKLVQDTRELNFYVPWLRLVIPESKDLTNEFNAPYRVSQWLDLERETHSTLMMITQQVKRIIKNEHTSRRTWMPSELVHMVRQGAELITQYNIIKHVPLSNNYLKPDTASVDLELSITGHPTIKWNKEALEHFKAKDIIRVEFIKNGKKVGTSYGEDW